MLRMEQLELLNCDILTLVTRIFCFFCQYWLDGRIFLGLLFVYYAVYRLILLDSLWSMLLLPALFSLLALKTLVLLGGPREIRRLRILLWNL